MDGNKEQAISWHEPLHRVSGFGSCPEEAKELDQAIRLDERTECARVVCQLCEMEIPHADRFKQVHDHEGQLFPCDAAVIWQRGWE